MLVQLLLIHAATAALLPRTTSPSALLFDGAARGDLSEIKQALASGANIDAPNDKGDTALILASNANQPQAADLLLDQGARVDIAGFAGRTATMGLAEAGALEPLNHLLTLHPDVSLSAQDRAGQTALILAAWLGHAPCVGLLVRHGAPVNETNRWNQSALIAAAIQSSVNPALILAAARGVDLEIVDSDGNTALDVAEWNRENNPNANQNDVSTLIALLRRAGAVDHHPGSRQ